MSYPFLFTSHMFFDELFYYILLHYMNFKFTLIGYIVTTVLYHFHIFLFILISIVLCSYI